MRYHFLFLLNFCLFLTACHSTSPQKKRITTCADSFMERHSENVFRLIVLFSLHEPAFITISYCLMVSIYDEQRSCNVGISTDRLSIKQIPAKCDYAKWPVFPGNFIQLNVMDSTRLFLNEPVLSGENFSRYYRKLQTSNKKQGKSKENLYDVPFATFVSDIFDDGSYTKSIAIMEKEYNYKQITLKNKQLIVRSQRYLIEIIIVMFLCFVFATFFFIERIHKRKLVLLEKDLRQKVDTKGKFFSIISHDLRNLSYSFVQLSEILYRDFDRLEKEKTIRFVKLFRDTAKQNNKLIENLLSWAVIQNNHFSIDLSVFDIQEVIESSIDSVHSDAELKQISIKTSFKHCSSVCADRNMIAAVLRNLLSNAIKFSGKGKRILVKTLESKNEITTIVADHGTGMTAGEIERLFSIDSQLRKEGTNGEKGNGLGLILCMEFIEKNNGRISVKSVKDKGTIFTFMLPKP